MTNGAEIWAVLIPCARDLTCLPAASIIVQYSFRCGYVRLANQFVEVLKVAVYSIHDLIVVGNLLPLSNFLRLESR